MEEVVIQSPAKPWLRKVGMLIFILGPILAWYKIPFPVGLGYALILFISAFAIFKSGFKINVLPWTFIPLFIYICFSWCNNYHFELWTLFPPGGWNYFIFVLAVLGGVLLYDEELCARYMRTIVLLSISLFYVQFILLRTTGSQHFCFVPPLTSEFVYEELTYSEMIARHLASKYPCSIFLEKSYMAYYLLAYLCLILFKNIDKEKTRTKEILLIVITLILLRSGSAIVGLSVLLIGKAFHAFWGNSNNSRRVLMIVITIPISILSIWLYQNSESGQELLSRQQEFTTEDTSGYSRVIGGYIMYGSMTPQEQMLGKPNAREVYTIEHHGTSLFYVNGVQTILLCLGYVGALLYLFFYSTIFKRVNISSRMCLIILLTMALLESNYLNPYMMLMTIIPCANYYYKNKKIWQ